MKQESNMNKLWNQTKNQPINVLQCGAIGLQDDFPLLGIICEHDQSTGRCSCCLVHHEYIHSNISLFAQALHALHVVLHGSWVGDLCGTAGRKPASFSISHSLTIAPG